MAKRRLTTFSKFLLTMLVVGGLAYGYVYLRDSGALSGLTGEEGISNNEEGKKTGGKKLSGDDVINIGVVTWGGYAGGQYFNEGFEANTNSRFYKDYGLKVNFEILDDFVASRKAFENGEVDLLWATVDAFPTEAGQLAGEPQIVFQADWSRGGDAVVARRGVNSVGDLKGKKIAVAELTPSHTFLLWLLEAGDLKQSDVIIEKFPSAIDAAAAFKADPSINAAVVWSPDDEDCVRAVPGAKILENTKSASNIIADVFLAKKNYIDDNKDRLAKLYEGWMKGAAELNNSDDAKRKAAKILAENFNGFDEATTYQAIQNVRLCTHGDNMNFFGLNRNYQGVTGEKLYSKMSNEYAKLGYMEGRPPSWRLISRSDVVQSANLVGSEHDAEAGKTFVKVTTEEGKQKEAIATKRLKIGFDSGSYQLDGNAKTLIDLTFVDIAKAFSNAQIRIEGNTDNVGSKATNISLSKKRAQAVANYLIQIHGMPSERFIIIGNGPDKPVAGCEGNSSAACKSKNRRTEFELVK
jgi:NitT/TauT family transport system substrate-binding protein